MVAMALAAPLGGETTTGGGGGSEDADGASEATIGAGADGTGTSACAASGANSGGGTLYTRESAQIPPADPYAHGTGHIPLVSHARS